MRFDFTDELSTMYVILTYIPVISPQNHLTKSQRSKFPKISRTFEFAFKLIAILKKFNND